MPVIVRRPAPPLDGLITAITYRAGEQPCTSVEKILPGPGTGLWVNLNRDEFRSFRDTGQVNRVPGAMISGPASHASVIEFEAGHAHVSVAFALGAARCFVAPPVDLMRDDLVPLDVLWGCSGGWLRERLLEAPTPEDALSVMEDVLRRQMTGVPGPDPAVIAASSALSRGVPVGQVSRDLGLLPRTLRRRFTSTCQRMAGSPSSSHSITLTTAATRSPKADPTGGCDARTGLRVVTGMLAIAAGPAVDGSEEARSTCKR